VYCIVLVVLLAWCCLLAQLLLGCFLLGQVGVHPTTLFPLSLLLLLHHLLLLLLLLVLSYKHTISVLGGAACLAGAAWLVQVVSQCVTHRDAPP